jgi:copper(I)-binding protein
VKLGARLVCALTLLGAAAGSLAVEIQARNPWVRSADLGQAATPAYVDITADTPLKLVAAKSPWAKKVELRTPEVREGHPVEVSVASLELVAGVALRLAPGGSHLALIDVTHAFGNGDFVPITLSFEDAGMTPHTLEVRAQARGLLLPKAPVPKSE